MIDFDMLMLNLFAEEPDTDLREQCDLAWVSSGDRDRAIMLDAAFILDAPPLAGTLMGHAYDRMATHTRATLALRVCQTALKAEDDVRARITRLVERAHVDLEACAGRWETVSALIDVLVGERIG